MALGQRDFPLTVGKIISEMKIHQPKNDGMLPSLCIKVEGVNINRTPN